MPLHSFDSAACKRIAKEMEEKGFACIPNVIDAAQLAELRAHVTAEATRHRGEYFAHHGNETMGSDLLESLGRAPQMRGLLAGLYRQAAGKSAFSDRVYQVLRCIQGNSGRRESGAFHYDATLLTILLPIEIPQEGSARGDLLLFPNLRRVRGNVVFNVLEKALLQNALSRRLINLGIRLGLLSPQRLLLVPGNLYVFWGYRSLHASEPCDPAYRRATALFHYGDPHAGSLATRLILRLNQHRARRLSETGRQQPV